MSWRRRRLAAIWLEAAVSALWAHFFLVLTVVWVVLALVRGDARFGANPLIANWGLVIAIVCVAQALVGIWLDRRYDPRIWRSLLWLPLFPLIYWLLLSAAAIRGTLPGAIRRPAGPSPGM